MDRACLRQVNLSNRGLASEERLTSSPREVTFGHWATYQLWDRAFLPFTCQMKIIQNPKSVPRNQFSDSMINFWQYKMDPHPQVSIG